MTANSTRPGAVAIMVAAALFCGFLTVKTGWDRHAWNDCERDRALCTPAQLCAMAHEGEWVPGVDRDPCQSPREQAKFSPAHP